MSESKVVVFTSPPGGTLSGAFAESVAVPKGNIITATSTTIEALAPGMDGQVLTADSAAPTGLSWAAGGGSGDVSGPGSSSVGDVALWNNTTGTLLNDSTISSDGSNLAFPLGGLKFNPTGLSPFAGIATLTGSSTVILTNGCKMTSFIFLTYRTNPPNPGILSAHPSTNSFNIRSSNPSDTGPVSWFIINPTP